MYSLQKKSVFDPFLIQNVFLVFNTGGLIHFLSFCVFDCDWTVCKQDDIYQSIQFMLRWCCVPSTPKNFQTTFGIFLKFR